MSHTFFDVIITLAFVIAVLWAWAEASQRKQIAEVLETNYKSAASAHREARAMQNNDTPDVPMLDAFEEEMYG